MKGKKALIAKVLYYLGILHLPRLGVRDRLIVFNYHRIRPDTCNSFTLFDESVFGLSASQFRQQMEWLKHSAKIISQDELIDKLKSGRKFSGLNVLITFDDGYRDSYIYAYPVLKKLSIPAIFFIPTNIINTRQLGWWDIIAYLIKNSKRQIINFDGRELKLEEERIEAINFFKKKMEVEKYDQTGDLLTRLAEICELDFPDMDSQDRQLMTWDQIREVSEGNITIGSHSHTHAVLETIPPKLQKEEMVISKSILEAETGKEIKSVAYPVGNYEHFPKEIQNIIREAGFELGFSFRTGINYGKTITPYDIKRICAADDFFVFMAKTLFPRVFEKEFSLLKKFSLSREWK